MEFDLSGRYAYVIQDTEEGCFVFNCNGFTMGTEQMRYLAERLLETAEDTAPGKLDDYNQKRKEELEKEMGGWYAVAKEPKPKRSAYVYMLECGGRYKIGMSADVNRRAAELDKRPFPVTIVAVSKATDNAYSIEQYLHEKLEQFRIGGEWYEIDPDAANKIKSYIEGIEGNDHG